jgi:hypothetical protein
MTVAVQTPITNAVGNGVTTSFAFNWLARAATDLVVSVAGVVKTNGVDYTVSGTGVQSGGSVLFGVAPANGAAVQIYRATQLKRDTDYQTAGDFQANTVDADFDAVWLALQDQAATVVGRALRAPIGELPTDLPPAATRANSFLAFDASGNPTVSVPVAGSAASVLTDLANGTDAAKGDALIAVKRDVTAPSNTLHYWVKMRRRNVLEAMTTAQIDDVLARTAGQNVTAAVASAVAALGGAGIVEFPAGIYLMDTETTIASDRVTLEGSGPNATIVQFDPTGTATCFNFTKGASSIVQAGVRGFGFQSSNSNTKTAIAIRDGRMCVVSDIGINSGSWLGASSVGLQTLGRDTLRVERMSMYCSRPVLISVNPNFATLHCDHFHFTDCELGSTLTAGKIIEIADGVNISDPTFDGYQAWTLGKYGLFWQDTTSTVASYGLSLKGVRTEQATDSTGYSVLLNTSGQTLRGFKLDASVLDNLRNGIFLRNVHRVELASSEYTGTTGVALDMTFVSSSELLLNNFWAQAGSTAALTNAILRLSTRPPLSTSPLPSQGIYGFAKSGLLLGDAISQATISLANNATAALSTDGNMLGVLTVWTGESVAAIFMIAGPNHAVVVINDSQSLFSVTAGTASKTNIYWSAGNARYEIENKRGSTIKYAYNLQGSYVAL